MARISRLRARVDWPARAAAMPARSRPCASRFGDWRSLGCALAVNDHLLWRVRRPVVILAHRYDPGRRPGNSISSYQDCEKVGVTRGLRECNGGAHRPPHANHPGDFLRGGFVAGYYALPFESGGADALNQIALEGDKDDEHGQQRQARHGKDRAPVSADIGIRVRPDGE
jgi:hypothetical protein